MVEKVDHSDAHLATRTELQILSDALDELRKLFEERLSAPVEGTEEKTSKPVDGRRRPFAPVIFDWTFYAGEPDVLWASKIGYPDVEGMELDNNWMKDPAHRGGVHYLPRTEQLVVRGAAVPDRLRIGGRVYPLFWTMKVTMPGDLPEASGFVASVPRSVIIGELEDLREQEKRHRSAQIETLLSYGR